MDNNDFNSNVSPLEMAEMNNRDAKQIDVALGVIVNEMPSKIASIKQALDNAETKINSLKTRKLSFNISEDIGSLAKKYDAFSQEVLNYSSYYELEIIKIINIFDRQNSLDGSSTVDNNFFKKLPFLGTLMFTIASYYGNGNMVDDFPQLALDVSGAVMDRDINETIGNLIYNGTEYIGQLRNWNMANTNIVAAMGLITVESLYDLLFVNTDSRQNQITIAHASADGIKLIAGNMVGEFAAVPAGTAVSSFVASKLAGFAGAKVVGTAAGGLVGAGIVVVSEITIDLVVEPIVAEITGETLIDMTSIPKNGGLTSLYSDYVKSMSSDDCLSYGPFGRTTSLYGMTVSSEYCKEMIQIDPVGTLSGLEGSTYATYARRDSITYHENSYGLGVLNDYLTSLKSIPKDSTNFEEQVDYLTQKAYGQEFELVMDMGFDPVSYAMNN